MIAGLLTWAAGEHVEPRELSERQYARLASHRSLTFIPPTWTIPATRNLTHDRTQLLALQMKLHASARAVSRVLTRADIEHRWLKGIASSELDYPDASLRSFGDVDVLVRRQHFDKAIDALQKAGSRRLFPGRNDTFTNATPLLATDGSEIDVHFRLCRFFEPSTSATDALFNDPVPLSGGGYALSAEGRLLHAAIHLMYTGPGMRRFSGLADISAIRSRHGVDLDLVRRLATDIGAEPGVAAALALERTLRGLPVDTHEWRPPSRLESASFLRADRSFIYEHLFALQRLTGVTQRVHYLKHWLLPSPDVVETRGGYAQYFRRLLPRRFGGQYGYGPR